MTRPNPPVPALYIFDLDGTLVDSFQDIADAVNGTLAALGSPTLPQEVIKRHVGHGARWLLARCGQGPVPAAVHGGFDEPHPPLRRRL